MQGPIGENPRMKLHARTLTTYLVLFATALLLAGCGGSDSDSGGGSDDGGTSSGGGSGDAKSIFAETCGGCHALDDAGTTGAVGPSLDSVKPDAELVRSTIDNGAGAMPAGLLEGEERDAVADYVAGAAGK